jgi:hypothetical protein
MLNCKLLLFLWLNITEKKIKKKIVRHITTKIAKVLLVTITWVVSVSVFFGGLLWGIEKTPIRVSSCDINQ